MKILILIPLISLMYAQDVYGCTDPEALNYFPDATIDDCSCIYEVFYSVFYPISNFAPQVDVYSSNSN